jgi:hypothetical protein
MRASILLCSQFGCGQMSLLTLKSASCFQPSVTKLSNLGVMLLGHRFLSTFPRSQLSSEVGTHYFSQVYAVCSYEIFM